MPCFRVAHRHAKYKSMTMWQFVVSTVQRQAGWKNENTKYKMYKDALRQIYCKYTTHFKCLVLALYLSRFRISGGKKNTKKWQFLPFYPFFFCLAGWKLKNMTKSTFVALSTIHADTSKREDTKGGRQKHDPLNV